MCLLKLFILSLMFSSVSFFSYSNCEKIFHNTKEKGIIKKNGSKTMRELQGTKEVDKIVNIIINLETNISDLMENKLPIAGQAIYKYPQHERQISDLISVIYKNMNKQKEILMKLFEEGIEGDLLVKQFIKSLIEIDGVVKEQVRKVNSIINGTYQIAGRQRNDINNFDNLIEDPKSIAHDKPYVVVFQNEKFLVAFNKKVVDPLKKLEQKKIKRIMETIKKGFVGPLGQTGIEVLNQNKSTKSRYGNNLIELKTIGELGYIRLGGIKISNEIYFNVFQIGSEHSKKTAKERFKKKIFQRGVSIN